MRTTPKINHAYWLCLVMASILGTNTGDFFAGYLKLGHLMGLPLLAIVLALLFALERFAKAPSAAFFWAAIIVVRTAATNVGDAFHDFHLGFPISIPLTLALFVGAVGAYAMDLRRRQNDQVAVTGLYWACMMIAGVLGTLGGDCLAWLLGKNPLIGALICAAVLLIVMRAWRETVLQPVKYWALVALIRTGGTAAGDALAHAITLPVATLISGLVFCGTVAWFYARHRRNFNLSAQPAL